MTPEQAIKHFGTQQKLAEALRMSQSSVSEWTTNGYIPWPRQFQIQQVTGGALSVDPVDPKKRAAEQVPA